MNLYAFEADPAWPVGTDSFFQPRRAAFWVLLALIVNGLFYSPNCNMVYGDAQAVLVKMIEAVRGLGAAAA